MSANRYLIDVEALRGLLDAPKVRIVDCRFELQDPRAGELGYLAGHIPGAVYADLNRDLAGPVGPGTGRHPLPDPAVLARTFGSLGISAATEVVVYDDAAGATAARAWWLLRWLSHRSARILDGGLRAWLEAGYAIEEGTVSVPERRFSGRPRNELVLHTDEIAGAGSSVADLQLVDARAASRFLGQEEPIDAVAGHVPGARNLPFMDNVAADGRWRPVSEIRQRLAAVIGEPAEQSWSVMCGSGVTACHLVVAGLLAGYPEPRVYVGSWSEWISDGDREVAIGGEKGPVGGENFAEDR